MAGEAGVMVVVLCCDSTVTMGMLRQMYGVGYDGVTNKDRLLDISTALSSAIYYRAWHRCIAGNGYFAGHVRPPGVPSLLFT